MSLLQVMIWIRGVRFLLPAGAVYGRKKPLCEYCRACHLGRRWVREFACWAYFNSTRAYFNSCYTSIVAYPKINGAFHPRAFLDADVPMVYRQLVTCLHF